MKLVNAIIKPAFCLILLLTSISVFSQVQSDRHYLFNNYNTRNGLINNSIYSIVQDKYGFIWIGSDLGLTRFDGKTFYHKAIKEIYDNSLIVLNIETTNNGNILCTAFTHGIYEQNDDGSFNNYSIIPDSINRNTFHTIKEGPDGNIYVGGNRILFRADGDSLTLLYKHDIDRSVINDIFVDLNNNIWFGGIDGLGVMVPTDSGINPVFIPEMKGINIVKILVDKMGVMHVATSTGYYRIVFDEPYCQGSKYTISNPFDILSNININYIYIDQEQNLWIPTSSNGVFRTKGDNITLHLGIDNGMLSSSVFCILQDREGNYWFGTNNGISMIENFDSFVLAKDGKLFQDYHSMRADKYDRLLIPSSSAFHIYQDEKLLNLDIKNTPLDNTGIGYLELDEHSVMWIANDYELFRMQLTERLPDLKKIEKVADLSKHNPLSIRSMFIDSVGVWICTQMNILHYHNNRLLPAILNHPDSLVLRPQYIVQDHLGFYWIGDTKNGIYRANLTENSNNKVFFDKVKAYKYFSPDSLFATTIIRGMDVDKKGNLWTASSYSGVYKHKIDSGGIVSSKLYSTHNGLLSNIISGITCKDDGRIWIETSNGTCILTLDDDGNEYFDYLGIKEGINGSPYASVNIGDRMFILTDEALFVTHQKILKDKIATILRVIITGLSINGEDKTTEIYKNKTLFLGNNQNNLTFEFTSITFRRAVNVSFQYKLDGNNEDWSELSERGFVEFSSLKPGNYSFNVRAVTDDATISNGPSFNFKIKRIYYQTFWFYLLIFALLSVLSYTFYKNRINNILRIEKLRSSIAADLHDDIGSTLSSIFLMSEMTSSNDKQSRLLEVVRKISDNSRDLLNSMDDIIWSVNPQDDSFSNLKIRLREYAIPVCECRGITFSMNKDKILKNIKLGMDERRNIYLIVKEAINNSIKHSRCTTLDVSFKVNSTIIEISITDNGDGFDPKLPTSRNGIANMIRRAEQIGCELSVFSEKDKGTSIRLTTKNHIFI